MRNIYFPPTVNKYSMYLTLKDSHWVKTRSSFSLPCYEWKFSASILFESFQVDSLLILYNALINYSNTTADLWKD